MKTIRYALTNEQFNRLNPMTHNERYYELQDNILPPVFTIGYGFYGCGTPFEEDGNYFINIEIGNSCD